MIESRTVPAAAETVLITAVEAAAAVDGLVSPVTVQETALAFRSVPVTVI